MRRFPRKECAFYEARGGKEGRELEVKFTSMRLAAVFVVIAFSTLSAAQEPPSALKALQAIPKQQLANLARIEAQDGTPTPERWHFLVHDPTADTGLMEYVVANGELVASRQLSQFAETLSGDDVVGSESVQIDSDQLAKLAKEYAAANKLSPATYGYELLKGGADARPLWKVSCANAGGQVLATLVLAATNGKVISHEGFAAEPPQKPVAAKKTKSEPSAPSQVAANARTKPSRGNGRPEPIAEAAARGGGNSGRSSQDSERRDPSRRNSVSSPVAATDRPPSGLGQFMRRILPFR